MSWSGLASNQLVSRNNLQDAVNNGVFVLKNSIPADNKLITVAEAEYYVYISTISKASNRLVVKSDLVSSSVYYTWYISYNFSDADKCYALAGPFPITVYSNNPSFLSYAQFFTNPELTIPYDGGVSWHGDSTQENGTVIKIDENGNTYDMFGC